MSLAFFVCGIPREGGAAEKCLLLSEKIVQ